jgi:hypothetical protein
MEKEGLTAGIGLFPVQILDNLVLEMLTRAETKVSMPPAIAVHQLSSLKISL